MAAIVVSEIIDRLSPNIAPLTTAAVDKATPTPVLSAIPTAIGTNATIVPTEVPTEIAIKHAITNNPAIKRFLGKIEMPRFTVDSTAPISLATCTKAPANINIIIINITLLSPAPLQNVSNFSLKLLFLFITKALIAAMENGIITDTPYISPATIDNPT